MRRTAPPRGARELAMDELGRADVDAAGRAAPRAGCCGSWASSRAISAFGGCRPKASPCAPPAPEVRMSKAAIWSAAKRRIAPVEDAAAAEGRAADPRQRHALGERQRPDHADGEAVLGTRPMRSACIAVGEGTRPACRRRRWCPSWARARRRPRRRARAGRSRDAGDADDLAGPQSVGRRRGGASGPAAGRDPVEDEERRAGRDRRLLRRLQGRART